MPRRLTLSLALAALSCSAVQADAVRLVSGEVLQGKTARTKEGALALQDADGKVRTFPDRDVVWVLEAKDWDKWQERLAKATHADSADGWFEAGEWAKKKKMSPEAEELLGKAVAKDPEHAKARKALGHKKVDGKWLTEDEQMAAKGKVRFGGRWIDEKDLPAAKAAAEQDRLAKIVHLDWEWTFEDDLTAEELAKKQEIVRLYARMLWKVGEGNFALREVVIRDAQPKLKRGTMHTPAGRKDAGMLKDGSLWAQVSGGTLEIPGRCDAYTWLHEVGHLLFGCPEEYDTPGGCPCVESTGRQGGEMQWCDAKTHSAEQAAQHPPCWEGYILKKYPQATHPGPGGEQPKVEVVINDN